MAPHAPQKRLQFIHLIWLALIAVALAWRWPDAAARPALLMAGLAGAMPGAIALAGLRGAHVSSLTRALLVMSWTLFATAGLVLTGAGLSPFTVFFAIAPLIALWLGAPRMAIEATVFAVVAYVAALAFSQLGWLPRLAAPLAAPAMLIVLAGLMLTGFLVAGLARRQRHTDRAHSKVDTGFAQQPGQSNNLDPPILVSAPPETRDTTAYFASLTHELKTPTAAIISYADMMREGVFGPLPRKYADYAEIIHESGQELLLRVQDILDLAHAESGERTLAEEPVDLSAAARHVITQLQPVAARRNITIAFDGDAPVFALGDGRAVTQIFQNLLSNALKFSDSGAHVYLATALKAGRATLLVRDTGIGMTPDDIARATEPFRRGGNIAGREGTGLGLAVVKSFVDRQAGVLHIRSAPGAGTEIEIALPEAPLPA